MKKIDNPKKFAIYRTVENVLYSLMTGPQKQVGIYLFCLINTLPVDLEAELFSFDIYKKRKNFPINISHYFPQHYEKFNVEVYVVERYFQQYQSGTFIANIIFAVKILKKPGQDYRLFFMLDKELHVVVYLHLDIRPYNNTGSEWESEINNAFFHYTLYERQRVINGEDPTGEWTWI